MSRKGRKGRKGKEEEEEKRNQGRLFTVKVSTRQSWLQQQPVEQKWPRRIIWLEFLPKDFRNNKEPQLAASYRHRSEQVLVIPHKGGYEPEASGLYPCLPLLPKWNPLFIWQKNIKVFTIKVLPLKREITTINGTEITVLNSSIFVPQWVLKKNETTVLFRDGNCCLIWIENIQKRQTITQELNRIEKNISGIKNPWKENFKNGMVEPPVYSPLNGEAIVDVVKHAIDMPIKKQIEELKKRGLVNSGGENGKTTITLPGSVGT